MRRPVASMPLRCGEPGQEFPAAGLGQDVDAPAVGYENNGDVAQCDAPVEGNTTTQHPNPRLRIPPRSSDQNTAPPRRASGTSNTYRDWKTELRSISVPAGSQRTEGAEIDNARSRSPVRVPVTRRLSVNPAPSG